jgi:uncharacterized protein (TIGR02147 family)
MASFELFSAPDYRLYLAESVNQEGARGFASRLAEAARCQSSHISRVLRGQLHLTMEQAFRIARFLDLAPTEESYFLKLVERDRCGDVDYRAKLDRELVDIRRAQEDLSGRLHQDSLSTVKQEMLYYSAWYWSAIHIASSIPSLQSPSAIARRLNLDETFVRDCLAKLESFGLVKSVGGLKFASGGLHLSKQSPMNAQQHANWRSRAVLDSQTADHDGVHYTVVQSISLTDYARIKQLVLRMIDDYATIARPSKEEELVCLACDFFKV